MLESARQSASRVCILLLPESTLLTFASVIDPLRAANRLAGQRLFEWRILSPDGRPVLLSGGVEIAVDGALSGTENGELLVVVAAFNVKKQMTRRTIASLRRIAPRFATLLAAEAGTWLLARAGLLRDHAVTTHWEDAEHLAAAHPALDVRRDRYVIDGRVWTSGGASPSLDMMLHYLRVHHSASLALDVASVFIYDESHAATDSQNAVSLGRIARIEPRVTAAIRLMERHLEEPLTIARIAQRLRLSQRTLEMLCRRHLGEGPGSYYRGLRLQTGHKLVADTALSMQEIALRCGFGSQSAFSRGFRQRFGLSPLQLRRGRN